eukprot:350444_1
MYVGILYGLPSTLLDILMIQIKSDEQTMATLFIPCAVSSAIFTILSAPLVDKVNKFHYFLALMTLLSAVSVSVLYYTIGYYQILFAYMIIYGTCDLLIATLVVGIFRIFNLDSGWMTSLLFTVCWCAATVAPYIITASITYFSNYSYAMYCFSIIGIISTILLIFIPSPPHEKLLQDAKKITKDVIENNQQENIDQYLHTKSPILSPNFKKQISSGITYESQISPAIISEINNLYKNAEINQLTESEELVLMNLFRDTDRQLNPYQFDTTDNEKTTEDEKTDNDSDIASGRANILPKEKLKQFVKDKVFWFDFERKNKNKKKYDEN